MREDESATGGRRRAPAARFRPRPLVPDRATRAVAEWWTASTARPPVYFASARRAFWRAALHPTRWCASSRSSPTVRATTGSSASSPTLRRRLLRRQGGSPRDARAITAPAGSGTAASLRRDDRRHRRPATAYVLGWSNLRQDRGPSGPAPPARTLLAAGRRLHQSIDTERRAPAGRLDASHPAGRIHRLATARLGASPAESPRWRTSAAPRPLLCRARPPARRAAADPRRHRARVSAARARPKSSGARPTLRRCARPHSPSSGRTPIDPALVPNSGPVCRGALKPPARDRILRQPRSPATCCRRGSTRWTAGWRLAEKIIKGHVGASERQFASGPPDRRQPRPAWYEPADAAEPRRPARFARALPRSCSASTRSRRSPASNARLARGAEPSGASPHQQVARRSALAWALHRARNPSQPRMPRSATSSGAARRTEGALSGAGEATTSGALRRPLRVKGA